MKKMYELVGYDVVEVCKGLYEPIVTTSSSIIVECTTEEVLFAYNEVKERAVKKALEEIKRDIENGSASKFYIFKSGDSILFIVDSEKIDFGDCSDLKVRKVRGLGGDMEASL
jgi:hypothetical protein